DVRPLLAHLGAREDDDVVDSELALARDRRRRLVELGLVAVEEQVADLPHDRGVARDLVERLELSLRDDARPDVDPRAELLAVSGERTRRRAVADVVLLDDRDLER